MSDSERIKDIEPGVSLEALDPGIGDPGYWARFRGRVGDSVSREMARRRRAAFTLDEVVLSWGRLVLPGAAVAAVIAALLVLRPSNEPVEGFAGLVDGFAGVEELLSRPIDGGEPLPAFLHSDAAVDRDVVLFAVEGF